jgi:hypothetical protein
VRQWPFACWDCGFESSKEAWICVSCECCEIEVSAMGRSLVKGSPTGCVYFSLSAISVTMSFDTYNR